MLVLREHLEDAARDLPLALDGLVRIGVGAERDGIALVAGLGELRAQERGRVGLGEELRLELESGREVEVGVRGSRVAVDAAELTAKWFCSPRIDSTYENAVPKRKPLFMNSFWGQYKAQHPGSVPRLLLRPPRMGHLWVAATRFGHRLPVRSGRRVRDQPGSLPLVPKIRLLVFDFRTYMCYKASNR